MTSWQEAHQEAMFAAAEAHHELAVETNERIDVFQIIENVELALMFRPLRGVSGLYVPGRHRGGGGVLVTSNHRLARQRFTAAHELGHFWLKHDASIDISTEVLGRDEFSRLEPAEMAAEAFAAWFLMPPELVDTTLEGLQIAKPGSAEDVYALSLRLGTSYQATAYHLPNLKLAPYNVARSWATRPPKSVKVALSMGTPMDSYHRDVWSLSERDADSEFEVRAGDRLVLTLPETPSSGVMWSTASLPGDARVVADTMHNHLPGDSDEPDNRDGEPPGATLPRTVILDLDPESSGSLELALKKAPVWAPDSAVEDYRINLHVQQPLLGRPIAA
jgi:Zn-dependent peptidase ImmA (M78 family)